MRVSRTIQAIMNSEISTINRRDGRVWTSFSESERLSALIAPTRNYNRKLIIEKRSEM